MKRLTISTYAYAHTPHHCAGLTVPLLTTSSGEKLGKSSGNAVWLSSSYQLYQAMLQVADQNVATLLHSLTFLSLEDISSIMEQHSVSHRN